MLNGYVSVPCNINVMSGVIYIEGEIKQISKGYLIASETTKNIEVQSPLYKVNICTCICIYHSIRWRCIAFFR